MLATRMFQEQVVDKLPRSNDRSLRKDLLAVGGVGIFIGSGSIAFTGNPGALLAAALGTVLAELIVLVWHRLS